MAWIHDHKMYNGKVKRWYCMCCDKRKPIELNPEWVADGKPLKWDDTNKYEWFARCAECHHKFYPDSYGCDNCGYDNCEQEPLKIENHHYNSYYSYEFGVTGYDWEELHQCGKCRHLYWISNSTC